MPSTPQFRPFTGLYEPSAIQQLPDGRFLVVEDEKRQPFSLVTITAAGTVSSAPLLPPEQADTTVWKLDDLEALTLDGAGHVYALTSHSRNREGEEKKARNKLIRFRIDDERMAEPRLCTGLRPALAAAHPALATAAEILDVKSDGGLNIEALEISPDGQQLLIGLRSPLLDTHALVARIENTAALFETGAPPRIATPLTTLDLRGEGIRALSYIPALRGYLVVSGPVARECVQFRLWFWGGGDDAPPQPVHVAGLQGFEHAEGVSPASIGGRQYIIIVSDDGDREAGRYAQFLLLETERLEIARKPGSEHDSR